MDTIDLKDLEGCTWTVNKDHIIAQCIVPIYDKYRIKVISKQIHFYLTTGLVIKTILGSHND